MDDLEKSIVGKGFETKEAASFFVGLKSHGRAREDASMAVATKLASVKEAQNRPGHDHPPLRVSPQQNAAIHLIGRLHQGASKGLSARAEQAFDKRNPKRGGPLAAGGAAGALGGAGIGALLGKLKGRLGLGALAGAAGGTALGLGAGEGVHRGRTKAHGEQKELVLKGIPGITRHALADALRRGGTRRLSVPIGKGDKKEHVPIGSLGFSPQGRAAILRAFGKSASVQKLGEGEEAGANSQMSTPSPPGQTEAGEYFEKEQAGRQAEEENASEYFRQRLQEANEQLQQLEEQSQGSQEQMAQLEQQTAQTDARVQAAEQEAQIAQQASLQNVQASNQRASQALRQAMDSETKNMDLKRGLMDLAAGGADSPPTAPMGGPMGAEGPDAGMNNTEQVTQEQEPSGQSTPGGAPGAMATPGSLPVPGTPQAPSDGQPASPLQSSSATRTGNASSKDDTSKKVEVKVAAIPLGRVIGGLAGAAGGAGLAASEAAGKPLIGGSLDERRESIQKREQNPKTGIGGFAQAFNLAKDKAMLSLGEYTKENPTAATIGGAAIGGFAGQGIAPALSAAFKKSQQANSKADSVAQRISERMRSV